MRKASSKVYFNSSEIYGRKKVGYFSKSEVIQTRALLDMKEDESVF